MISALLLHPIALVVLLLVACSCVFINAGIWAPMGLSQRRLYSALAGVAIAAAILAAPFAYASLEDAARFGVSAQNRWSAIRNEYMVLAVLMSYIGVLGAALV